MAKLQLKRKKLKIGYKCVYSNQVLHSFLGAKSMPQGACVKYSTEFYSERPRQKQGLCGPLAVFKTFEQALIFRGPYVNRIQIWLCLYQPSKAKSMWWYKKNWDLRTAKVTRQYLRSNDFPMGTQLADFVMLVERMK